MRLHLLPALLATSTAAICLAQTPSAPAADDPMRGPAVKETAKPATLVQHDMSGMFIRLDTRPEQAAIDLLRLTPMQRQPADEVLSKRALAVTKLLQDNYEMFIKLQVSRQGGAKPDEIRPLMRDFRPVAMPLLNPTLESQVAAAIPEDRRAEYTKLVDEYKRAIAVEEPGGNGAGAGAGGGGGRGRRGAPDGGDAPKMDEPKKAADDSATIPPRVEFNLLLREMARTLKGISDERKEHMEAFLKAIDATPEQEAQIRAIVRESAEAARGKHADGENESPGGKGALREPSQEDKIANWKKILDLLTPEQRKKAMEARRGG